MPRRGDRRNVVENKWSSQGNGNGISGVAKMVLSGYHHRPCAAQRCGCIPAFVCVFGWRLTVADLQEILTAANNLGALISKHATVNTYKETIRQLDLDVGAKTLLQQYEQLIEMLTMKEQQGQPIDMGEKQQFEQLQQSITMNPMLKKFAAVQGEYMDLMKKVQETINGGMSGQAAPAIEGGAGGGGASKIILDT
jgi:cell fate (sporulation/competence/biofilm development) regulator YlbF (YheA/YmcA/DUF963 family)